MVLVVAVTCYGCGETMYVPIDAAQRMAEEGNEHLCLNCLSLTDAELAQRRKRKGMEKQKK